MVEKDVSLIEERQKKVIDRLDKIELCMYGEDGRGGLCKDISDIKQDLHMATSITRVFLVPVGIALLSAFIGYFLGNAHV